MRIVAGVAVVVILGPVLATVAAPEAVGALLILFSVLVFAWVVVGSRRPASPAVTSRPNNFTDDRSQVMEVFIDFLPNQPRDDRGRENLRRILLDRFEQRLSASIERVWDLPAIVLQQPANEYVPLLHEARELFVSGHFYSCVAMCGIVGERLIKDVVRTSVLVQHDGRVRHPAPVAFDQLERVEISSLCRFLKEAELLDGKAAKAADGLCQLRNRYAHARGKNPKRDAAKAIELLHILVEDTVSVFKDFRIENGALVMK